MKQEIKKFVGYKILKNLYIGSIDSVELDKVQLGEDIETHFYYFYNRDSKKWAIPQNCESKNIKTKQQIRKGLEIIKNYEFKCSLEDIKCIFDMGLKEASLVYTLRELENKPLIKETRLIEDEIEQKLSGKFIIINPKRERILQD